MSDDWVQEQIARDHLGVPEKSDDLVKRLDIPWPPDAPIGADVEIVLPAWILELCSEASYRIRYLETELQEQARLLAQNDQLKKEAGANRARATTIQPLTWNAYGHVYVAHLLGLVYYIDPLQGGAGYKTIHAGETLYEGINLDLAKQAAQDHAQKKVREVLG